MVLDLVKAAILPLAGAISVGVLTWGLITQASGASAMTMTVVGLLAYVVVWVGGLYITRK